MDNRETLTPSSGDAILKRHLFSEVARNWIKGRGHIERAYFVRRPSRQSFGFRVAASSGPIPKAPGSAGGYLPTIGFSGAVSGLSAHFTAGSSQVMHWRSARPEMLTTGTNRFPHFGQRVVRSMRLLAIFPPYGSLVPWWRGTKSPF